MPAQVITSVENNFTKGLITEATGLNFPENAATSASNCEFTIIGDVIRRMGINFEANGAVNTLTDRTTKAMSSYVWNNPGGDGNSKLLVRQIGATLYFYNIAASTVSAPLSTQRITTAGGSTVDVSAAVVSGGSFDATIECQYASGNGYLFVYHPSCDPISVKYDASSQTITNSTIQVQIRDFIGVLEPGVSVTLRPLTLTNDHTYNLYNQGWTSGNSWSTTSTTAITNPISLGSHTITVGTGLSITNGDTFMATGLDQLYTGPGRGFTNTGVNQTATMSGTVTSYTTGTGALVLNVTSISYSPNNNWAFPSYGGDGTTFYSSGSYFAVNNPWQVSSINKGLINTWHTAEGNYPSNADIWWTFKDNSGVFNPATTQANVGITSSTAPQGHYVLNAFNMDRNTQSGLTGITAVSTLNRPTTGCWFQGRVWYTGVNAFQAGTGDVDFYTWTENIYFSQIVQTASDFGLCYQNNDPSSETLNALLPTDGGVITLVDSGTIHKLFPIANGLLVFANNGVWFITGSSGIGFSANDYTVTQISKIKCLSAKSFVDVNGLPYFWNEEGIYQVIPNQSGQLTVEPLTVGTILSFYNNIPLASKKYARGSYDPINYTIQWCYRSTQESTVTDRYQYDSILNFSTYNRAFFPYTLGTTSFVNTATPSSQYIHGVDYISYPYISTATPEPGFKYHSSEILNNNYNYGFAEEYDTAYVDFGSSNYVSNFTTGYKLHGQGLKKTQIPYVYVYSRNNGFAAYQIQSAWDYGITFDSNRWSQPQYVELNDVNAAMIQRRHKLRGQGYVLQLMFTSVDGQPFDIMGWGIYETMNTGV